MISILNKNDKLNECRTTLNVSYLRNVKIIHGHYPYPDVIHNLILKIKNNLKPEMENYTNVKGGMTDWDYFVDKPEFINFISYLINTYQTIHPDIFEYFLERKTIKEAWGNEIKSGGSLSYHGFENYDSNYNRYSLIFNIVDNNTFDFLKKIKEKNERQNS